MKKNSRGMRNDTLHKFTFTAARCMDCRNQESIALVG